VPFVRPKPLVARVALTAALALIALPGLASSRTPQPARPPDAAAFRAVSVSGAGLREGALPLDPAYRAAGAVARDASFVEPGVLRSAPTRPAAGSRIAAAGSEPRQARQTLTGWASFYDNGTTAMRLPRGTLVVICGAGGCIERRVTDYGPNAAAHPERIADLYRPDFFAVCGCPSFSGTTRVTVSVY
jgi:hypothetical protein